MNDEQLLRYGRQILLPGVDVAGQERLAGSRVLILGLGGLGSPAALYLAGAGVGELVLVDDDVVEISNLQRQIAHTTAEAGTPKAESAARRIAELNPEVATRPVDHRLDEAELAAEIAAVDLVLDCSDNFATRFAVNRACATTGRPLVSGAAIRMEGQVAVFDHRRGGPCYRCLYREEGGEAERCSESGVLGPVVGIVGSWQAAEALKLLLGVGTPLTGRLLMLDLAAGDCRTLALRADPACPVCGDHGGA
ncbi:MAG: HesA/MoeB/ThiF family protein [Thiohalospira sp.]